MMMMMMVVVVHWMVHRSAARADDQAVGRSLEIAVMVDGSSRCFGRTDR